MAALLLMPLDLSAAEYRLSPGDVLSFAIAGAPDMHQDVTIDVTGSASLPLIGEVQAAGKTIEVVRGIVRNAMSAKQFRQHGAGSTQGETEVIWPDQVVLSVSEYRPVYLNGDVAKPGEQKFRPGMTVRQALSLAGGYDILRFRMDNPFLETAELRGASEAAWVDFAREQARLWRIRIELGTLATDARLDLQGVPLSAGLLADIRQNETDSLKTLSTELQNQRTHLDALLVQSDTDIASMTKRHDTEATGAEDDSTELKRVTDLNRAGTLPLVRVVEARRIALLSATAALQSEVEIQRAKTEREVTRRKRENLEETTRKDLLAAEGDSQAKLGVLQTRIQALNEKMLYAGALKTQLARGTGGTPDLVLFRAGQPPAMVAEDAELQPGDTVEVALKLEHATSAVSAMR